MPKGYWSAQVDIENPEAYAKYRELSTAAVEAFGGRFIVRGGQSSQVEGSGRTRLAVVEFGSYDDALRCYESDEYQRAAAVRQSASSGDIVIVEGVD